MLKILHKWENHGAGVTIEIVTTISPRESRQLEFDLSSRGQNQDLRSMALHKRLLQSGISPFLLEWSNWNAGENPLKTKIFILATVIISSSNGNWPKDVLASLEPTVTSGHVRKPDTKLLKKKENKQQQQNHKQKNKHSC